MAKKKELDKLSLDMIECEKAGYGCHYGRWKATQKPTKNEPKVINDGWLICKHCGKPFKPKTKRKQIYCEAICQRQAQYERLKQRKKERENESNA